MNFKSIKELFFPNDYKCILCGEELNHNTLYSICDECMNKLPFNNGKVCIRCGEPLANMSNYCLHCKKTKPYFTKNTSLFLYEYPINKIIRQLKYDNKKYLSLTFSNMIAGEVSRMDIKFDMVIPVPLFEKRQKLRGYNQSELLAESLYSKLGIEINTKVLVKIKSTRTQANLTRAERMENLENAFKVTDKKLVKGKTILLVDDVFTTGTTINECSKTLIEAGASKVYSVTLAHAHYSRSVLNNVSNNQNENENRN